MYFTVKHNQDEILYIQRPRFKIDNMTFSEPDNSQFGLFLIQPEYKRHRVPSQVGNEHTRGVV